MAGAAGAPDCDVEADDMSVDNETSISELFSVVLMVGLTGYG